MKRDSTLYGNIRVFYDGGKITEIERDTFTKAPLGIYITNFIDPTTGNHVDPFPADIGGRLSPKDHGGYFISQVDENYMPLRHHFRVQRWIQPISQDISVDELVGGPMDVTRNETLEQLFDDVRMRTLDQGSSIDKKTLRYLHGLYFSPARLD